MEAPRTLILVVVHFYPNQTQRETKISIQRQASHGLSLPIHTFHTNILIAWNQFHLRLGINKHNRKCWSGFGDRPWARPRHLLCRQGGRDFVSVQVTIIIQGQYLRLLYWRLYWFDQFQQSTSFLSSGLWGYQPGGWCTIDLAFILRDQDGIRAS